MKLQKGNVIYEIEDLDKIQEYKAKGFKEVKRKSKLELNSKENSYKDKE